MYSEVNDSSLTFFLCGPQMKETFGDQGMKRKAVVQAIQQVEANIAWRKHSEKEIEAWLKAMLQKLNISTD